QKSSRTTTGADGSFGFSGLAPGQYQLTIRKSGFQPLQSSTPITILANTTQTTHLAPSLWPDGAVTGRIVDWDGELVSEAEVRAYAIVYHPAGAALSLAGKEKTNVMGEYRLF